MESKVNYRHITVAVMLTAIILGLVWFFSESFLDQSSLYKIYTQESVSGLLVGAPVELKGVDVGKIKNIKLKNINWIEITLSIRNTVPITKGTVATLMTRGLTTRGFTGFVYVVLNDNGTDLHPLVAQMGEKYPIIPMTPSTALTLDTTLTQMNKSIQKFTEVLLTVLDKDNVASLKEILHGLKKVTNVLAVNNQKLDSLLGNMEKASHQFEPFLKSGQGIMNLLETQTLPAAHRMFSHLDPFLKSGQSTMMILETQTLPATYQALSHLEEMTRELANLTKEIKQDPSLFIRGVVPPLTGPGELNESD